MDESSGFDEKEIDSETNPKVNSSTPIGKENDRNFGNHRNYGKSIEATDDGKCPETVLKTSNVSVAAPLQPRSLIFSPIDALKLASKNNVQNMHHQPIDDFFATPSIKPPPTTGRVIFSSSQHKLRQPRKLDSDYQKTLFTTPQQQQQQQPVVANHHRPISSSNTSDYETDSFNSIKKTSFMSVLSPIDEEKISIDDFQALSATDDNGTALSNKVLEINGKEFILKKKIGCGGSCIVYSSKCRTIGADVALKVVNLRTDDANVESYLNETKLLGRLQGNPCVIKLFEQ